MSIKTEVDRLKTAKMGIASALERKGVTVPPTATLSEYEGLVDSISTSGSTSDATATPAEIFIGKTAYLKNGKQTGTFTIENELATQNAKLNALQNAITEKAGFGGSCGPYSKIEFSSWIPTESPNLDAPKYTLTPEEIDKLEMICFFTDAEKLTESEKLVQAYINLGKFAVQSITDVGKLVGPAFYNHIATGPDDPYPSQNNTFTSLTYNPVEHTLIAGDQWGGLFSIGATYTVIKFFK